MAGYDKDGCELESLPCPELLECDFCHYISTSVKKRNDEKNQCSSLCGTSLYEVRLHNK
jgi:hypothetical protein